MTYGLGSNKQVIIVLEVSELAETETIARLIYGVRALVVEWADGQRHQYHYIWLRDNSPDARRSNGQRWLETAAIPAHIQPSSVKLTKDGAVEVIWADTRQVSRFSPAWLRQHAYSAGRHAYPTLPLKLWDSTLADNLPQADYAQLSTDVDALRRWLVLVKDYGFALLRGVEPISGQVTQVVDLFGYLRETNRGRCFDIELVPNSDNLVDTHRPLLPHTDQPYRDPVPTLHLLHCLSAAATGGESILVDGFHVAETLRRREPAKFAFLANQLVRFRFWDEQNDLSNETTLIRLNQRGEVTGLSFNNRWLAPFDFAAELIELYYEAHRAFAQMLNDPAFQIVFKLEPGDLLIMDNERTLHGRTAFSPNSGRHLQGCYADRDGLYSRLRVLARSDGETS